MRAFLNKHYPFVYSLRSRKKKKFRDRMFETLKKTKTLENATSDQV